MYSWPAARKGFILRRERPVLLRVTIFLVIFLALFLSAEAQEGEWIELPTLGQSEAVQPQTRGAETDSRAAQVAESQTPRDDAGGRTQQEYDWRTVTPDSVAVDGHWSVAGAYEGAAGERPTLDLPKRFFWKGQSTELGHAGYVFLGDHYFVEENDYEAAEAAYRYALGRWPDCGPIQMRLDLLQIFLGDWLLTAENLQVGFGEGLPPAVNHQYGISEDSPILSSRIGDVPPVPAILFRLALSALRQVDGCEHYDAAREFLEGRLQAFLGEHERALYSLGPVAMDDASEPWNFQAASQRAELYLVSWRPELAYTNLLRAKDLAGEHPTLMMRIEELREALVLHRPALDGERKTELVRIIGEQGQGRWVLSSPRQDFAGTVNVQQGESETQTHLLFRGRDYWLMTIPLGENQPDWKSGSSVTLSGLLATTG